jgi:hypothetical protein
LQDPPKFTQIDFFGLKIWHLATLFLDEWRRRRRRRRLCLRFTLTNTLQGLWGQRVSSRFFLTNWHFELCTYSGGRFDWDLSQFTIYTNVDAVSPYIHRFFTIRISKIWNLQKMMEILLNSVRNIESFPTCQLSNRHARLLTYLCTRKRFFSKTSFKTCQLSCLNFSPL